MGMSVLKYNVFYILFFFFIQASYSQILTGKVFDKEAGTVLSNCNISVSGTNRGTITNEDGLYSLEVSKGLGKNFVFSVKMSEIGL